MERNLDITPHMHLISTVSETPGFRDMPEMALVLDTPRGPVVVAGCSHPGIENMLANITKLTGRNEIYEVIGGLHLVVSPAAQVDHTLAELFDHFHIQRMAPGHCTGEHTLALVQKRLGSGYIYAGTGETFPLDN